ncbi:HdeD family acid-resistance protein [Loigolactobacillus zhaoyuanensis]|uniref:HdeD family acid-resistance protein n=1 Tax=Loigolactobacillus zhaoyuanensis TaxID=2486017 RepID=A0ABW8UDX1_9LACO
MQTLQRYTWLRALVYFIFGAVILLFPHPVFSFSVYAISLYLLLSGCFNLINGRRVQQQNRSYILPVFSGVFKIIAALFVLIFARVLVSILPVFLGILLLIYGIFKLIRARDQRQFVNVTPWSGFIYSILIILIGGFLLINPFRSVLLGFQIFGVGLIVMSIGEIVAWWQARRH